MKLSEIKLIYDYNYWATKRLLTAAEKLSLDQFIAPAAFPYGGLRGTLVHILDAECSWRMLLQRGKWTEDLKEAEFPTCDSFEIRWLDEQANMRAYLASLDDAVLTGIVRYTADNGIKRERVLWHCLYHVVNHGTQHRSEAAAVLTDLGQSPGDVDFTFFLNEMHAG